MRHETQNCHLVFSRFKFINFNLKTKFTIKKYILDVLLFLTIYIELMFGCHLHPTQIFSIQLHKNKKQNKKEKAIKIIPKVVWPPPPHLGATTTPRYFGVANSALSQPQTTKGGF